MNGFRLMRELSVRTDSKILLLVVDGLGGLPHPDTGRSELETANTPNLDALARRSACGLTIPVSAGVTPGSGPGHLALFGYDPMEYVVGRGALEALGIGIELGKDDVAVRCNFATLDERGALTDRRAGRIPSAESAPLVEALSAISVDGAETLVEPVQDYRFVVVFRGEGLGDEVSDTDPQRIGVPPLEPFGATEPARRTARMAAQFIDAAREMLAPRQTANAILMRGFSKTPSWRRFGDIYKLDAGAVAAYPMYRGLASLVGMDVLETGADFDAELDTVERNLPGKDFVFLHYKPADAAGEDGDFDGKARALEELDKRMPRVVALGADVLAVTGDHSTPAILGAHSWHPVPALISSASTAGMGVSEFSERRFAAAALGIQSATTIMPQLMAHAGKLQKYGA